MDIELLKVLDAKEQRWNMRKLLTEKWQSSLITVTLCIPIKFRTNDEFWILFHQLCKTFESLLISNNNQILFQSYIQSDDGPVFFIATKTEAKKIKKICVEAEENIPGGRMLDIDVMDSDGTPIGRSDIGLPPRRCFVCENPAALCVSRKLHSQVEVFTHVEKIKEQIKGLH